MMIKYQRTLFFHKLMFFVFFPGLIFSSFFLIVISLLFSYFEQALIIGLSVIFLVIIFLVIYRILKNRLQKFFFQTEKEEKLLLNYYFNSQKQTGEIELSESGLTCEGITYSWAAMQINVILKDYCFLIKLTSSNQEIILTANLSVLLLLYQYKPDEVIKTNLDIIKTRKALLEKQLQDVVTIKSFSILYIIGYCLVTILIIAAMSFLAVCFPVVMQYYLFYFAFWIILTMLYIGYLPKGTVYLLPNIIVWQTIFKTYQIPFSALKIEKRKRRIIFLNEDVKIIVFKNPKVNLFIDNIEANHN